MSAEDDEAALALRLRVAELERELDTTASTLAARTALLDAMYRSRVWSTAQRLADRSGLRGPAAACAEGYIGAGPDGARIPLAGLPAVIDGVPPRWLDAIDVGGVTLGGMHADPPAAVRFRIAGREVAAVRAFAALRTSAWTRNRGGVRFRLHVEDADGRVLAERVRVVDPGGRTQDRGWVPLTLALPAGEEVVDVVLATAVPEGAAPDYGWALWGDPVLLAAPRGAAIAALPGRGARLRRALRRVPAKPDGGAQAPAGGPLISLLLPVHDPDPALLRQTLDAVLAQSSARWELCIVDDGSADPAVADVLGEVVRDDRVRIDRHESAQGIAAATNAALALARGEFVATLDHDDVLAPHAVGAAAARLARDPGIDVLYSDNDKLASGVRFAPSLKPDWSPELLRACMYTLHLGVYRRRLVEEVGGWRSAFDGAQDHDLVLRLAERTERIAHLPETLYSWRAHAGSAALGALAKPQAYARAVAAIGEHLERVGIAATAEQLPEAGRYRVVYEPCPRSRVSVVLVPPDGTDAAAAAAAIADAIGAHDADGPRLVVAAPAPIAGVDDGRVVVTTDGAWGARAVAAAAVVATPITVVLETLATPLTGDWATELAGPLAIDGVVATSPLVLDEADRVVHAGVAVLRGVPLPVHPDASTRGEDVAAELTMVTDRSAAAGIVAVQTAALAAAGGVHPQQRHLGLTELTWRMTAAGGRVVCSPHAPWRVLDAAPRPVADVAELRAFAVVARTRADRFYNPRLWHDRAAHVVPWALQQTGRLEDLEGV